MTTAAILLGVVVICAGALLIWIARISWQRRLARNAVAGVRTRASMRSDEAFAVANKAAAPYAAAGGGLFIVGGVATMLVPRHDLGLPLFSATIVALAVIITGAIIGDRACR